MTVRDEGVGFRGGDVEINQLRVTSWNVERLRDAPEVEVLVHPKMKGPPSTSDTASSLSQRLHSPVCSKFEEYRIKVFRRGQSSDPRGWLYIDSRE